MTILLSITLERGMRNNEDKYAFLSMILVYIQTVAFLIAFSLDSLVIALSISIILFIIPITLRNLGFWRTSLIIFLLSNEIIMSLLYYVILRGFNNALVTLFVYGTDIPAISINSLSQIFMSLAELANSFMFFLMIFPEIVYFSLRSKDYYPILLSSIALSGPNIASEMTHSILPLPYDPVREASILVTLISFSLSIYVTYLVIRGKMSVNKFVTFVILNLALSTSSLYYSISINEIPYGLLTLIAIYLSLSMAQTKANPINVKLLYIDEVILAISQFLWGASIALWYNLIYLQLSIGLSLLLVYLLSSFYVIRKVSSQRL
ncbi:hypothetical protein BFU36_00310 [Sulfolobus sp. A20]|nr:hypothetical protein BFU36_00310 [Sulfolobus sp. A20]